MSHTVANYVCSHLEDIEQVTPEVLLTTRFLIEKWKMGMLSGPNEELAKSLEEEEFSSETMEHIRVLLVQFASSTSSIRLFQQAIWVLSLYGDKRHIPLFQTWLLRETESLLNHNSAMWSLLLALRDAGEEILDRQSLGLADVEDNLDDARGYLARSLGIRVPW